MDTKIWLNNGWRNIKPEDAVNTTRAITSFCCSNGLRNVLLKSQGGWYYLSKSGHLEFVTRALYLISFQDLYNILSREKTISHEQR